MLAKLDTNRRILMSDKEWEKLQNQFIHSETEWRRGPDNGEARVQIFNGSAFEFQYQSSNSNAKQMNAMNTDVDQIKEFVRRTRNMILQKQQFLPIELKRALFLSNVFTEKANQLKFRKVLRQLRHEKKNQEAEQTLSVEKEYRRALGEQKQKARREKNRLNQCLRNELRELESRKKQLEKMEREQQRAEIVNIEIQLQQEEYKRRSQEMEAKTRTRQLLQNDQLEKRQREKISTNIDREESNFAKFQNSFVRRANEAFAMAMAKRFQDSRRNKTLESILTRSQPKAVIDIRSSLSQEEPRRGKSTDELHLFKKPSEIERKREKHAQFLQQERIKSLQQQIRESDGKKTRDKDEKRADFQRRQNNLKVTQYLHDRKMRQNFNTSLAYCQAWSEQCEEKKLVREKETREDATRLEKLQKDTKAEDEEFLKDVRAILKKYGKEGKNTLPIIKCLKEFHKSRHAELTSRNKMWASQVPI